MSCFVFFLSGCTGEQQTHTAAQSLGPFVGFGTGTHPRDHQHNHEYSPHPDGLEKSRPTSAGPRGTGVGDTPHSAPATASELSAAWLRSREDLLLCEDCVRRTRTQAQTGRKGLQRTHPTKDRSPKYIKPTTNSRRAHNLIKTWANDLSTHLPEEHRRGRNR